MNSESTSSNRAAAFVQNMIELCKRSNAARSALRRSVSPEQEVFIYVYLSPWIDLTDIRKRKIYTLVASMLASEKDVSSGSLSLGKALQFAVKKRIKKDSSNKEPPLDPRFRRLLATDGVDDALLVLRPIISLIQARCPGQLDYISLLRDLEWYDERVRVRWARDFFGTAEEQGDI